MESLQRKLGGALVEIAFMLPPDVQRLVEDQSRGLNLLILGNRRSHAELIAKLKVTNVEREPAARVLWKQRLA
eukprot:tig00021339_g20431.t1